MISKKVSRLILCLAIPLLVALTLIARSFTVALVTATSEDAKKIAPNDPLNFLNNSASVPIGVLTYIANIAVSGQQGPINPFYLVSRYTGNAARPVSVVYRVMPRTMNVIFDVQIAPDGKQLLFKEGWPYEDQSTYRLYILNLTTKQVQPGPAQDLVCRKTFWSPNSKKIAFIVGGNAEGLEDSSTSSSATKLCIYNVSNGTTRLVASHPDARSIAWTAQNSLLYSLSANDRQSSIRPSIYEAFSSTGKSSVVVPGGYAPAPSPDGKWIAFFGWPLDERLSPVATAMASAYSEKQGLYLYNRSTKERILISPDTMHDFANEIPSILPYSLLWMPNGKSLLVLRTRYSGLPAFYTPDVKIGTGLGEALIQAYSVPGLATRHMTTIQAEDFEAVSRSYVYPEYQLLSVTNNGAWLIMKVHEYVSRKSGYPVETNKVQAINFQSGRILPLAQTKSWAGSSLGLDWHEGFAPAPQPVGTQNVIH